MPAAPIHATPHFVAFFVPRVVVYASSQDFVETALGQPYLNTKGAFMPALYPIPGFSTHPDDFVGRLRQGRAAVRAKTCIVAAGRLAVRTHADGQE